MELPHIQGARMPKVNEAKRDLLSRKGPYVVCVNPKQARKDARDREAIIKSLKGKIKARPKNLIGNKGDRKYLKIDRDRVCIDQEKVEYEFRFDGRWVLITNTDLSADQVALK